MDTQHDADDFAALRSIRDHRDHFLDAESMRDAIKVTVVGYGPTWALPVNNMRPSPLQAQPHVYLYAYLYSPQPRQRKANGEQRIAEYDTGTFRSVIHRVDHSISEHTGSDVTGQRCRSMPLSCPDPGSLERHGSPFWLVVGFPSSRWLIAVVLLCCCCYKLDPSQTL